MNLGMVCYLYRSIKKCSLFSSVSLLCSSFHRISIYSLSLSFVSFRLSSTQNISHLNIPITHASTIPDNWILPNCTVMPDNPTTKITDVIAIFLDLP